MSQASYEQLYGQLPQANTYLVSLRVSIILTLLGFFVNYYLRKVDMLEALKSVE
ncbi:ABC transporter permease [Streptococcus pneumoniae]|nr:ABC transporter permease [Streptococcus pneumoniae]